MESWTWRWDGVKDMEMRWSHGHGMHRERGKASTLLVHVKNIKPEPNESVGLMIIIPVAKNNVTVHRST